MPESTAGMLNTPPCVGDWHSRGKIVTITQRGNQLVLEMGSDAPILCLTSMNEAGQSTWPMKWAAFRSNASSMDPKDALYLVELPASNSPKLLVRRPVGDGVIEFTRSGAEARKSKSRSKGRCSRSTSPKRGEGFLPGDWNCPKCGDHQFARNLSCRSCGTSKPGLGGGAAEPRNGGSREALVNQIKRGQRESKAFKERWWDWCDRYGHGFYDPVRHETRFMEDFLDSERRGGRRSRSGSRSYSGSRSRSRSRTRSRRRRRRKHKRGHRHKKRRRSHHRTRKQGKKRKRSSSRTSSSSEAPEEDSAVKKAQSALADAEKNLEKIQQAAETETSDVLQKEEEKEREEVTRITEQVRNDAEKDLSNRLREAEEKLLEERAARLREAEQRLDKAIATRLKEAEKKLRREADVRIEEMRRAAEDSARDEVKKAEQRFQADAASKVDEAKAQLATAKERVKTLKAAGDKGTASDADTNSGSSSDSSSGSESE